LSNRKIEQIYPDFERIIRRLLERSIEGVDADRFGAFNQVEISGFDIVSTALNALFT